MKAQIPSNVVGYILTHDYCEIQPPNGHGFAFQRQHPVRGPDGKYDPNAEWVGMFQSRMRSIIKEHGFPILHEEGMKPMAIASTKEEPSPEALAIADNASMALGAEERHVIEAIKINRERVAAQPPQEEPEESPEREAARHQMLREWAAKGCPTEPI